MTDSPTPADESHPSDSRPPPNPDRSKFVGIAIAMAAILFLGTAGLLYRSWATMREPRCVLIVEAPPALRGAEVTVRGIEKPYTVTIGAGERFAIPFYLDYGSYDVRVSMKGQELYRVEANLTREQPGQRLDLAKLPTSMLPPDMSPATTAPAPFASPSVTHGQPSLVPPPPTPPPPAGADTLGRP